MVIKIKTNKIIFFFINLKHLGADTVLYLLVVLFIKKLLFVLYCTKNLIINKLKNYKKFLLIIK